MNSFRFTHILGIPFFTGSIEEAVERAKSGGLVVVPSGPGMAGIGDDSQYRDALLNGDLVLPDSGYMVLLWQFLRGRRIPRISGLKFLKAILELPEFQEEENSFWIMPNEEESELNRQWLRSRGFSIADSHVYVAPLYNPERVEDALLREKISDLKPRFVVLNIGGGIQEKLGYYLKRGIKEGYRPTIICTGAAIAFLTGKQAPIPTWADRFFLGWFLRCLKEPTVFLPRYIRAFRLVWLILRYGSRLPE